MKKEIAMDMARFETLADAYGADLRRWPASERATAEVLLASEPKAKACLVAAEAIDDLLAIAPPAPSATLRAAIIASAPKPRRSLFEGMGFWLSGAGLAAAGVAGILVGAAASNAVVHEVQTESVLAEVLPETSVEILPLSRSAEGDVA